MMTFISISKFKLICELDCFYLDLIFSRKVKDPYKLVFKQEILNYS